MQGTSKWSYAPYAPFFHDAGDPYICRIAPVQDGFTFEYLPKEKTCTLYLAKRGEEPQPFAKVTGGEYTVAGLEPFTDYAFYLQAEGSKSCTRLVRTGEIEGIAVNYLHPEDDAYAFSGRYLCSPSLLTMPGYMLASMDLFAPQAPQNLTLIFRSDDEGKTWHYQCELMPCFWGKLFTHKGKVYMLSVSNEYGDLLLGCSEDGGKSFGTPVTLLRGSCLFTNPGVHKNPQNIFRYHGRIYETLEWGCWTAGFHAPMVMSCDENDDIMVPENWHFTPPVKYDSTWPGVADGPSSGNIEGTLTVLPDGKLYNIMRYDMTRCTPNYGKILAYAVNTEDPDAPLTYSHSIAFPANHSKFTIRFDEPSGYYVSIATRILDASCSGHRNLLSLMASKDCEHWFVVKDLLDHRDEDPAKIGFQYVDFHIRGEKILYLCRTARNGADSFHNSNYCTFHVVEDFRSLLPKEP